MNAQKGSASGTGRLLKPSQESKLREQLASKDIKKIKLAIQTLELADTTLDDWTRIFNSQVMERLIETWDFNIFLLITNCFHCHENLLVEFFSGIANRMCDDNAERAILMLECYYGLPFNFRHETTCSYTQGYGTIVFEAFYRELILQNKITMECIFDPPCSFSSFSTYLGELFCPSYDLEEGTHCCDADNFTGPGICIDAHDHGRFVNDMKFTFSCNEFNFIPFCADRLDEDGIEDIEHIQSLLYRKYARHAPFVYVLWIGSCLPGRNFNWTARGIKIARKMGNEYVKYRRFVSYEETGGTDESSNPGFRPCDFPGNHCSVMWEASSVCESDGVLSYTRLSEIQISLLYKFLLVLRSQADSRGVATAVSYSNASVKKPVLRDMADHLLMCMAMHRRTPESIIEKLKKDASIGVAKWAKTYSKDPKAFDSPRREMKSNVEHVTRIDGTIKKTMNRKLFAEAESLAVLALASSIDSEILDAFIDCAGGGFDAFLGCALAVGITCDWIETNTHGAKLISETLDCIRSTQSETF